MGVAEPAALAEFRRRFYNCCTLRGDALFELTDAVLCADGPVGSLVELSLAAEHRRGHGALYDSLSAGRIDTARLRRSLADLPISRDDEGRITLAVDVSPWPRPDAPTSGERLFCHCYGRGKGSAQMIPGWPYSFVAALETGRTSWTTILDAQRLGPSDDPTEVTAAQVRELIERLRVPGGTATATPTSSWCSTPATTSPGWPTCSPTCPSNCSAGSGPTAPTAYPLPSTAAASAGHPGTDRNSSSTSPTASPSRHSAPAATPTATVPPPRPPGTAPIPG